MLPDKDRLCHRTNFTLSCRELVAGEKCKRWKFIAGAHPQTGAELHHYDCLDDLTYIMLLNIGHAQAQLTASIDKKHNADTVRATAQEQSAGFRHDEIMGLHKTVLMAVAETQLTLGLEPPKPKALECHDVN